MTKSLAIACIGLIAAVTLSTPCAAGEQQAGGGISWSRAPAAIAVRGPLPPAPAGVVDLKFREFFRLPVGPLGLEPTEKLLSLNGRKARIVGYMVQQEKPVAGVFILAPVPVAIGDDDDGMADDLPPSAVFVHLDSGASLSVPNMPGLIALTGVLSVGPRPEPDGRVSAVRLQLAPELTKLIAATSEQITRVRNAEP
jgi:hypothetical protein